LNELLTPKGTLQPWAREMYFNHDESINLSLVRDTKGVTVDQLRAAAVGGEVWDRSSLSLEDFQFHYEFGKFPHAVKWVRWFYENLGETLTREDLYKYVRLSDGLAFEARQRKTLPRVNVY
jgi:hypothetical protein